MTAELDTIKNQDVVFVDDGVHMKTICPVYQKRLRDIVRFLLLIVCTQNQPTTSKENAEVLRMRNNMVSNYRQIYHKIKVRQLRALLNDIRSFKMKSDKGLENKLLHELINMPLSAFA